jgi:hypothetical protein
MGTSTISMAIFNSKLFVYQRVTAYNHPESNGPVRLTTNVDMRGLLHWNLATEYDILNPHDGRYKQ